MTSRASHLSTASLHALAAGAFFAAALAGCSLLVDTSGLSGAACTGAGCFDASVVDAMVDDAALADAMPVDACAANVQTDSAQLRRVRPRMRRRRELLGRHLRRGMRGQDRLRLGDLGQRHERRLLREHRVRQHRCGGERRPDRGRDRHHRRGVRRRLRRVGHHGGATAGPPRRIQLYIMDPAPDVRLSQVRRRRRDHHRDQPRSREQHHPHGHRHGRDRRDEDRRLHHQGPVVDDQQQPVLRRRAHPVDRSCRHEQRDRRGRERRLARRRPSRSE